MSVRLTEVHPSREFEINDQGSKATFHYMAFVTGESNPEDAIYDRLRFDDSATTNITPFFWNGLFKMSPSARALGGGWYQADLLYTSLAGGEAADPGVVPPPGSPPPPPPATTPAESDPLTQGYAFDLSGEPQRISHSIFTLSKTGKTGTTAPDYEGAIGDDGNGQPVGVEILLPKFEITITKQFQFLSQSYMKVLRDICGKTNIDAWRGYEADEVLFLGANGTVDKNQSVQATFRFGIKPTERDILIRAAPNEIKVPLKPGWYHLWVLYGEEKHATSGKTVVRAQAAYVERVFKHTSFTPLQIGD